MVEDKGAFGTDYAENEWGETRADKESARGNLTSLKLVDKETVQVRFLGKRKETLIHWNAHPEKKMLVCARQDDPKAECPICDYVERIGDSDTKAKWRCYINVLDRRDGTIKQWDFAPQTKQQLHSIIANRNDINADSPLAKFEIRITRKGAGIDTKYEFKIANQPTELTPEDVELVKEGVQDLDKVYVPTDLTTLKELFPAGAAPAAVPKAEPAAKAAPVAKAAPAAKAAAPVADAADDTLF